MRKDLSDKAWIIAISMVIMNIGLASISNYSQQAPFPITLHIASALKITIDHPLTFPETVAKSTTSITITPNSTDAAEFNVTGEPGATVIASIIQNSAQLNRQGGGGKVQVSNFKFNKANKRYKFNAQGRLNHDISLGATANIGTSKPGDYQGTATFRVTYI